MSAERVEQALRGLAWPFVSGAAEIRSRPPNPQPDNNGPYAWEAEVAADGGVWRFTVHLPPLAAADAVPWQGDGPTGMEVYEPTAAMWA